MDGTADCRGLPLGTASHCRPRPTSLFRQWVTGDGYAHWTGGCYPPTRILDRDVKTIGIIIPPYSVSKGRGRNVRHCCVVQKAILLPPRFRRRALSAPTREAPASAAEQKQHQKNNQ